MSLFQKKSKILADKNALTIIFLLSLILVINFITMPKTVYVGDPIASRRATLSLINNGSLNISSELVFGARGQYFYQNPNNDQWYSKYGTMNTLMFIPPMLLEKILTGKIDGMFSVGDSFYLNIYNIILTLIIAYLLFKITSFYTTKNWLKVCFILLIFYATFTWHYLRAQSFEIFQLLFFLAFYYYLIKFLRGSRNENILLAFLFLLILSLTKLIFILLVPILFLSILQKNINWSQDIFNQIKSQLKRNFKFYFVYFAIPTAIIFLIVLSINLYKFGSPLNTGYTQWLYVQDLFSGNIFEGIYGFLFDKQWSIFLCFPILIFSLFGLPQFYKKYRDDFFLIFLIFITFLLIHAKFPNWKGEWSYGPRYLLFILPILSLPFLEFIKSIKQKFKPIHKQLFIILMIATFGYSTILQINVNSLDFFSYYKIKYKFSMVEVMAHRDQQLTEASLSMDVAFNDIENYFRNKHFGKINQDISNYLRKGEKFYPIEKLRLFLTEEQFIQVEPIVKDDIEKYYKSNYYWPSLFSL